MPGYDIYHRFGESSVFGAFSWKLNQDVALKILTMAEASDPRLVKAFARQNKGLAQLPAGANLVPVHAVGKVSELVMAIMDRVHGESVARLVGRSGALTWKCAVEVAMEVARAMRIAQDLDLPDHRLHPDRILLSNDGGVHVSFCCLPRGLQQGEVPLWAHLEDLRGEPANETSDVYVVGMILFYVATGQPPFAGDDVEKVTNSQLWARPDLAKLTQAGCPASLIKVVDRALAKHPNDRYPNPSILMASMKSVLNNDAPGYLIGSYREVLAQLVRDEVKDAEAAKAAAIDQPEPEPEDSPRMSRIGKRAQPSVSGLRRASVSGRKTASMSVLSPVGVRSTPQGVRRVPPRHRNPLPRLLGLGGGLLAFVLVLAFVLLRKTSNPDTPSKPPVVVGKDETGAKPPDPRPGTESDTPERLYQKASELEEQGSNESALAAWGKLIAKSPEYSDVHFRRGALLHEMRRDEEAIDDIDLYLQRKPDEIKAHQLRAEIYDALGQYQQGIEACDQVLARDAGNLSALEKRAHLQEKRGDRVGAAIDYRALIARGVERQEVLQPYAQLLEKIAWDVLTLVRPDLSAVDADAAGRRIDEMIAGGLAHPLIYLSRARLTLREKTPATGAAARDLLANAIALYDQGIAPGTIHPDRGFAYALRVDADNLVSKFDDAFKDAQHALADGVHARQAQDVFEALCLSFHGKDEQRVRHYAILSLAIGGVEPEREERLQRILADKQDIRFTPEGLAAYVEPVCLLVLKVERAGWPLQRFDEVLAYDGAAVRAVWELRRALLQSRAKGGQVVVRVRRQGTEVDLNVPAGDWPVSLAPVMKLK